MINVQVLVEAGGSERVRESLIAFKRDVKFAYCILVVSGGKSPVGVVFLFIFGFGAGDMGAGPIGVYVVEGCGAGAIVSGINANCAIFHDGPVLIGNL